MKKFFAVLLAFSLLGNAALPVYAAQVAVAGHTMETLGAGTAELVPLREAAEALGLTVAWDRETASVSVSDGTTTVRVDTKENAYTLSDGTTVQMAAKAERSGGKAYVPVPFWERFFGL